MEVGILSMQRVANYGSFWQAYCLKKMITEIADCNPQFIDIIPGEIETRTDYKRSFSLSKIKRIPYYLFQNKKKTILHNYQKQVLGCDDQLNFKNNYDTIIIGSDEVFNFVQESPWGFTTQLYGDIENDNVNSYAASFGYTTIDAIFEDKREEKITNALNNLRNISVRDINSAKIINKLTGRMPEIHLDPVLVGDFPDDKLPDIKDNKYILVYSYDFRMSDPDIVAQTRSFAKKNNLKIISVGFYQDWVDKNMAVTPYQLLSYFRNADYIVTDTFHGTVFSSRMHKRFVTIIRDNNSQKLGDLLLRIGLNNRLISKGTCLNDALCECIDYHRFESLRLKEKTRTEAYLRRCLLL